MQLYNNIFYSITDNNAISWKYGNINKTNSNIIHYVK